MWGSTAKLSGREAAYGSLWHDKQWGLKAQLRVQSRRWDLHRIDIIGLSIGYPITFLILLDSRNKPQSLGRYLRTRCLSSLTLVALILLLKDDSTNTS